MKNHRFSQVKNKKTHQSSQCLCVAPKEDSFASTGNRTSTKCLLSSKRKKKNYQPWRSKTDVNIIVSFINKLTTLTAPKSMCVTPRNHKHLLGRNQKVRKSCKFRSTSTAISSHRHNRILDKKIRTTRRRTNTWIDNYTQSLKERNKILLLFLWMS